jgi:hypothetical protein
MGARKFFIGNGLQRAPKRSPCNQRETKDLQGSDGASEIAKVVKIVFPLFSTGYTIPAKLTSNDLYPV